LNGYQMLQTKTDEYEVDKVTDTVFDNGDDVVED